MEESFLKDERKNLGMLYGSETWCLRENDMAILSTEKAMCEVELIEKRRSQELMSCPHKILWMD